MFNFGTEYKATEAWSLDINMRYTDSYYSSDTNDPELRVNSYTVVNFNTTYQFSENLSGFIYVKNALDKHAPLRKNFDSSTNGEAAYLLEPRELGAGIRLSL